jgi:hypothetical protein
MNSENSNTLKADQNKGDTKKHSLLFKEGEIKKEATNSLNRTSKKTVVDSKTEKTMLDSESESESPLNWGSIGKSVLVCVSDDSVPIPVDPLPQAKKSIRSKRSPNRDDSDSEDEDGNKIKRNIVSDDNQDLFDPESDTEFKLNGLKVGFAEDRNKRFRRTMEVILFLIFQDAHFFNSNLKSIPGQGMNCYLYRAVCHI